MYVYAPGYDDSTASPSALLQTGNTLGLARPARPVFLPRDSTHRLQLQIAASRWGLVSSVSRHTHFVFFVFPPITFCIINLSAPGGPGLGTPKTSPPRAQQRMRKSQANSKAPNAGVTRSLPSGVQFPASTRNMRTTPSASCCLRTDRGSQRNLRGADRANPPTAVVHPPFSLRTVVARQGHPCERSLVVLRL